MAESVKEDSSPLGPEGRFEVSVIIPTLNGAVWLDRLLTALIGQTLQPGEILVVDSGSTDATLEIVRRYGVRLIEIPREQFDHGGTRSLAVRGVRGDLVVFFTQDAIPADNEALARLVAPLAENAQLAAVYGRQLPNADANPFSTHLRLFNYPPEGNLRCRQDRDLFGFRTIFISKSFSAYRRTALEEVGLFPARLLFGEDTLTVAKLLDRGWCVEYVSKAVVYHSHNYTVWQDFKRYFDIGAFHALEWGLLSAYGAPTGAGKRFVRSEIAFLLARKQYMLIPQSLIRNGLKWVAYILGRRQSRLPRSLARAFSMHSRWWQ